VLDVASALVLPILAFDCILSLQLLAERLLSDGSNWNSC
jgi:hypothetical protein